MMAVLYYYVGKPGEKLKITAIDIRPDPPLKGQALVVNASFILSMACLART